MFGIARSTATPSPTAASIAAIVTPAAIDSTRVAPAAAASAATATMSGGFTDSTADVHGGTLSASATPGNIAASASRRSAYELDDDDLLGGDDAAVQQPAEQRRAHVAATDHCQVVRHRPSTLVEHVVRAGWSFRLPRSAARTTA